MYFNLQMWVQYKIVFPRANVNVMLQGRPSGFNLYWNVQPVLPRWHFHYYRNTRLRRSLIDWVYKNKKC